VISGRYIYWKIISEGESSSVQHSIYAQSEQKSRFPVEPTSENRVANFDKKKQNWTCLRYYPLIISVSSFYTHAFNIMEIKEKSKWKRKQIGTVFWAKQHEKRIVDSSSQKLKFRSSLLVSLEMQTIKKIKMLGDIAPIISLFTHREASIQQTPIRQNLAKQFCYSITTHSIDSREIPNLHEEN